jgi:S-adenosylmethionine/arginine decarboxylase-like enzyme
MPDIDEPQSCDQCGTGRVVISEQEITFHQWTDRGYVYCRATIPMGVCDHCGSRQWDDAAEAIIEEVVRQEYEKLR